MVRVLDLDKSIAFYELLGLKEIRRNVNDKGRFTLVFMAAPGQEDCPVELTYNWDGIPACRRTAGISAIWPTRSAISTRCARA
jgi:catechol 2,3-dioxygenase-like lactoylglutathione lyase family enzyme